ncbi:HSP20-like chaperone [Chlorella sorokiniana]|uniref:HSP20-like chaperone n=1 Tax=Chlorella sorokiniana TaxID=3076 RepID=A0A2P6TS97_CHLSO|nr:HSP20-like chaperone [Chlorella sorokiniana]|eukprot:PRW56926.1 HSP20-like chaperone [Chlorella sorokiniana]
MASSTALVQLTDREMGPVEQGLAPYNGVGGAVGEPLERRLERLRQDREAHSRKQVWTKDAHGGPYRKASAATVQINQGYDPLIQLPDGRDRPADLGYERVKTGPTSNFVGNHMTQGAIDLVQAQLEQPARATLLLGAGSTEPQLPRLLDSSETDAAAAVAGAAPRPLQHYRWLDDGGSVRVEVPVDQAQLGCSAAGASVTCTIQADRLELLICAPSAPDTQEANSPSTLNSAPSSGSSAASGAPAACQRLLLHPLHAAVVPAGCRCYVKGLPALPPGLVGYGATHIVVELCKADAQQEWAALLASRALSAPAAGGGPNPKDQPDVAALRRALRQKLSRGAALPIEGDTSSTKAAPSTGTPSDGDSGAEAAAAVLHAEAQAACQAALLQAEALVAAGQHAEALHATAPCLPLLPALGLENASLELQLRALRGHCQAQLGCLKRAVAEYGAAIQAAQVAPDASGAAAAAPTSPGMLAQLLLARAALYEQQEQLQAALADAQLAASLRVEQAPAQPLAMQAAERLRRACRQAARM